MSLNLVARAADGRPGLPSTTRDLHLNAESVRKNTVNLQYFHAQELQRERLRQAEDHRLRRLALRARRAVAGQLTR
ncbi:MAG TPA: hypothetical protein VGX23_06495 [Actinocrinis sp.]|nr:hypothetical protein [Actinocrinis sp.]